MDEQSDTLLAGDGENCCRWLKHGDLAAFEALYDMYCPLIFSLMARMLGSSQDAEELAVEFWVGIWNRSLLLQPGCIGLAAQLIEAARQLSLDRKNTNGLRCEFAAAVPAGQTAQRKALLETVYYGGNSGLRNGAAAVPIATKGPRTFQPSQMGCVGRLRRETEG